MFIAAFAKHSQLQSADKYYRPSGESTAEMWICLNSEGYKNRPRETSYSSRIAEGACRALQCEILSTLPTHCTHGFNVHDQELTVPGQGQKNRLFPQKGRRKELCCMGIACAADSSRKWKQLNTTSTYLSTSHEWSPCWLLTCVRTRWAFSLSLELGSTGINLPSLHANRKGYCSIPTTSYKLMRTGICAHLFQTEPNSDSKLHVPCAPNYMISTL